MIKKVSCSDNKFDTFLHIASIIIYYCVRNQNKILKDGRIGVVMYLEQIACAANSKHSIMCDIFCQICNDAAVETEGSIPRHVLQLLDVIKVFISHSS